MPPIGFSTGALFRSDVSRGAAFSIELETDAIELSALRVCELDEMIKFADRADLSRVRVQAKLTVVKPELMESIAPQIAQFANTPRPFAYVCACGVA